MKQKWIIKWSIGIFHDLKANYNELLLLLTMLDPMFICLQEIFLKNKDNLNIKDYQQYNP